MDLVFNRFYLAAWASNGSSGKRSNSYSIPMRRLQLYLFASLVLGGGVTCFQSPISHHRRVIVTSLNAADSSSMTIDELKAELSAYLIKREEANADDVAKSWVNFFSFSVIRCHIIIVMYFPSVFILDENALKTILYFHDIYIIYTCRHKRKKTYVWFKQTTRYM